VDPDPNKKYTQAHQATTITTPHSSSDLQSVAQSMPVQMLIHAHGHRVQIQGVLLSMLTDDIIPSYYRPLQA